MTEIQIKQLAFLEETINHFNSTNRASKGSLGCIYSPIYQGDKQISEGCAIGRKLPLELATRFDDEGFGELGEDSFGILPKELQELKLEFLVDVQDLHDLPEHWNENGLTNKGQERANEIKSNVINSNY